MELPEVTFFNDFYFWFNTETKKEYYGLISKEDLYKGNRNFTEVKMINNVIN